MTTPRRGNRRRLFGSKHDPRLPSSLMLLGALAALTVVGCAQSDSDEASGAAALGDHSREVRNVVLITVDTLRADALGFMGKESADTPRLDRMASEGLIFEKAHAHNTLTLPSHANVLTGLLPTEHGVRSNNGYRLEERFSTIAEMLAAQGFATGAFVASFPLDARFGLAQGFEHYDDAYGEGSTSVAFRTAQRSGTSVVSAALSWWRENSNRKRFSWIHLFEPHAPYSPPSPHDQNHPQNPYQGEVAFVDRILTPLLDELDPASTLLVFTSDHGEGLGEHGELTHGLFTYESTLHVPLVFWGKDVNAGRSALEAMHIDIVPTLLDATATPRPEELGGRNLLSEAPTPKATYFEALEGYLSRGWAPLRGVLQDGNKLISLPIPELYDLDEDPRELRNLLAGNRADSTQVARPLARLLSQENWPPQEQAALTAEEIANLERMGYVTGNPTRKRRYSEEDDPKNRIGEDQQVHQFIDLFSIGRYRDAIQLGRQLIEQSPSLSFMHYYLAQAELEAGLQQEAIETMKNAVSGGWAHPPLIRQLGLTLAEAGRSREAVELLEAYTGREDPDLLITLGKVLAMEGRSNEARSHLARALELDADNPSALENLALAAIQDGSWDEAERQARAALAVNSNLPLAWNYLAITAYNGGRADEAFTAWQRSVELEPKDFDVLYNLAFTAARERRRALAERYLTQFVEQAPRDRFAREIAQAQGILSSMGN